jgi:parvulin-like peptidyl-prolyl isomerase
MAKTNNEALDTAIFGKKTLSNIFEEIYNNSKKKDEQITNLIGELQPLIQDIGDASLVVPLIKEYLDAGIKNDDQLVKLASIIQKVIQTQNASTSTSSGLGISDEEKKQLLQEVEKLHNDSVKQLN